MTGPAEWESRYQGAQATRTRTEKSIEQWREVLRMLDIDFEGTSVLTVLDAFDIRDPLRGEAQRTLGVDGIKRACSYVRKLVMDVDSDRDPIRSPTGLVVSLLRKEIEAKRNQRTVGSAKLAISILATLLLCACQQPCDHAQKIEELQTMYGELEGHVDALRKQR